MTEENTTAPSAQNDGWQEVVSENGRTIRWTEDPKNKWQTENTVFLGTEFYGLYEEQRSGVGENQSNIYLVRDYKHGLLSIWGNAVLDDKLADVPVGSEVKISRGEEKKSKKTGKPYFMFTVAYRQAPMKEVKPAVQEEPEI